MSYILDALKKSDRDRQLNTTHSLSVPELEPQKANHFKYILVLLSLLVFSLSAYWLWSQHVSSANSKQEPRNRVSEVSKISNVNKEPSVQQVQKAPSSSSVNANNKQLQGQSRLRRVTDAPQTALDIENEKEAERIALREQNDPSNRVPPKLEERVTEQQVEPRANLSALVPKPPQKNKAREKQSTQNENNPIVNGSDELNSVEQTNINTYKNYRSLRNSLTGIGDLHLDILAYSNNPTERVAYINMQKYYEGDELSSGARITQITSKGVVLEYRSREFILTAN